MMNLKLLILFFLSLALNTLTFGQSQSAREKIEAAKIGMITERLDLTPEQAQAFWPIYKEFNEQRHMIRKEFRQERQKLEGGSEDNNKLILEKRLESKQKQLNLEKEYSDKMSSVISSRQINSLKNAEEDFRRMLLRRVEQRQLQRDNQNNLRQQNREQLQNRQLREEQRRIPRERPN